MPQEKFKGKVAIVTAGSRRLGQALVLKLAALGFDIALHYNRSGKEAAETAAEVQASGRRCEIFQCEFSDINAVQTLLPAIKERMGTPSLLINNASMFVPNTLKTATMANFDEDFAVHVKTPLVLMQQFALLTAGAGGHIVNIVDTTAVRHRTTYFTYLLSKKSLLDMTFMAANELAPEIRVNAIAPGIILPAVGWDEDKSATLALENPLKRKAGPQDIVLALEYLINAEQVTGQCLYVDCGDHVAY